MMNEAMKRIGVAVLLLMLTLFQANPALARRDELIQQDVEARIAESWMLRGARIEVHVERWVVVLTGEVRLYEQKLIAHRIAWTTPGVFEVDNEIRVVPKARVADAAIEWKIREIVNADERFRAAGVLVRVDDGEVFLSGSFLDFRDPSRLKHKVAAIEGVIAIKISAAFLIAPGQAVPGAARG